MKRLSLLTFLVLFPLLALAQEWTEVEPPRSYKYDGLFFSAGGAHGIVMDKYDRLWICGHGMANTGIHVVNQDGTPADFSPIASASVGGTTIPTQTRCRGMAVDSDGHILAVIEDLYLVRFNVDTGAGMAIQTFDAGHAKPGVDDDGYAYTARVSPPTGATTTDVKILNIDSGLGIEVTASVEPAILTRALAASGDGLNMFIARESGFFNGIYHYTSDDAIQYELADTLFFFDGFVTALDWGTDGMLWASDEGLFPTNREFTTRNYRVIDVENKTYWTFRSDSLGLQPRGVAMTENQDTLYIVSFHDGTVQRFVEGEEGTPISGVDLPEKLELAQNYPNPFTSETVFRFDLTAPAQVSLAVYDVMGRRVQALMTAEARPTGSHTARWDGRDAQGRDVAAGTYFYVLEVDGHRVTRPAVKLK